MTNTIEIIKTLNDYKSALLLLYQKTPHYRKKKKFIFLINTLASFINIEHLKHKQNLNYNNLRQKNTDNFIFNKGYYINLKQSIERKKSIESQDFIINIERYDAIKNVKSHLGCSLSHYNLLNKIYKSKQQDEKNEEYFFIIEDDFYIANHDKYKQFIKDVNKLLAVEKPEVIIATASSIIRDKECINNFHQIYSGNTTAGYIIKHSYIPTLLTSFKESIIVLHKTYSQNFNNINLGEVEDIYCIDQIWCNLMIKHNWVCYKDITFSRQNLYFEKDLMPMAFTILKQQYTNFIEIPEIFKPSVVWMKRIPWDLCINNIKKIYPEFCKVLNIDFNELQIK